MDKKMEFENLKDGQRLDPEELAEVSGGGTASPKYKSDEREELIRSQEEKEREYKEKMRRKRDR